MALRKIGVLTFHRCINYGSYWQARCLVESLRAAGHDAVLLDHTSPRVNRVEWRCALQPQLPWKGLPGDLARHSLKTRQFLDAIDGLPLSAGFGSETGDVPEDFEVVVVGSDEVWNLRHPWYGGNPLFFGKGIKAKRVVSYAASFGSHSASEGLAEEWTDLLAGFHALSVRDQNSAEMVRNALGSDPELVLDPCLLFPPVAGPDRVEARSPYVAVYGHGMPGWFAAAVKAWADCAGLRLVSIGYRNDWADKQRIAAGPEQFARLMAGAAAVVTNFFHGCVFALLNGKPFACVSSDYRANKLRDLMQTAGTQQHLLVETDAGRLPELLGSPLDPEIGARLGRLRVRSRAYLDRAVGA